ncbi:hypothetical protein GPALN_009731 [Globodera pallida]|nr:hypothetical protein GPALN_009731 [Globodera pallida]
MQFSVFFVVLMMLFATFYIGVEPFARKPSSTTCPEVMERMPMELPLLSPVTSRLVLAETDAKNMIKKALSAKNGSSREAILKFIMVNFDANGYLKKALTRAVASGDLKQVKGFGASGSFKLHPETTTKPAAKTKPW